MVMFELAVVVNGKLTKDEANESVEKIKLVIQRHEGIDIKTDDWGKRRLAYEIQNMREGYYYFISFKADDDKPSIIEKKIRIIEDVLRFLIVKAE